MPGVKVTTSARSGPTTPQTAPSGQYFVTGITERGSIDRPVSLRSMADYARLLGARVTYGAVYDDVRTFFEEGGSLVHVARVVGATPTVGTLALADRSLDPGLATIRLDAQNPGAWSTGLTAEVQDGQDDVAAGGKTFNIVIRLGGVIVERYDNLPDPATAVTRMAGSEYVKATNLGNATPAGSTAANSPRVAAAAAFSAGADDRATATVASYIDALSRFGIGMGDGIVAIPGQTIAAAYTGIADHCRTNRRLGILVAPRSTDAGTLRTTAAQNSSEFTGLFAPWVQVSDGAGGSRAITPDGFVAAKRSLAHATGPWVAPAGEGGRARYVIGVDQEFDALTGDALYAGRVNAIRTISGTARLYGWRSTSKDEANFGSLTSQDMINRVVTEGEARLEPFVFQVIDGRGQLLSRINGEMVGMLEPMRAAGGLYPMIDVTGDEIDPGYRVSTGPEVNTPQTLARNEVKVDIGIRPSPTADLITYSIVKVGLTAGL